MATAKKIPSAPIVAFGRPASLRIAAHSDALSEDGSHDHNGTDPGLAMTAQTLPPADRVAVVPEIKKDALNLVD